MTTMMTTRRSTRRTLRGRGGSWSFVDGAKGAVFSLMEGLPYRNTCCNEWSSLHLIYSVEFHVMEPSVTGTHSCYNTRSLMSSDILIDGDTRRLF